jgi:hypothetical protein
MTILHDENHPLPFTMLPIITSENKLDSNFQAAEESTVLSDSTEPSLATRLKSNLVTATQQRSILVCIDFYDPDVSLNSLTWTLLNVLRGKG